MHRHNSAVAEPEHDDLVLEQLPNGEHAWLKPKQPERDDDNGVDASGRWDGTWPTYIFRCVTTYSLVAPSFAKAADWFDDARADIELVDCAAMTFGIPVLVEIIAGEAES